MTKSFQALLITDASLAEQRGSEGGFTKFHQKLKPLAEEPTLTTVSNDRIPVLIRRRIVRATARPNDGSWPRAPVQ